jgi:dTDP-4-dehydrorhamnose 3,5-epimerase
MPAMRDDQAPQSSSLLDRTLAAAVKDQQMVTPAGVELIPLLDGMRIRPLPTHADARGSVTELYDPRWGWHDDPLCFAYTFSIRPGIVKGWNLHEHHEDRYAIVQGEIEVVLFDPRPESKTCGHIVRLLLSERKRMLVNIPRYVWHADHNIGATDAVMMNFPTRPYNHETPDRYRLPIDTPLIPFSFGDARGW